MIQGEEQVLTEAANLIADNLIKEFDMQGHHLTGAWEKSLQHTLSTITDGTLMEGYANYYGSILNAGVSAERVPYREGSGAGTSKYINGLISFWKQRGLSDREAKSAAFATAKKQKSEGMPTKNSSSFSKTGQRSQFIETVDTAISTEVDNIVMNGMDRIHDNKFHETKSETI